MEGPSKQQDIFRAWLRSVDCQYILWLTHKSRIYLLYVYGKNEASSLSTNQKKQLRAVVAGIKQES